MAATLRARASEARRLADELEELARVAEGGARVLGRRGRDFSVSR